MAAIGQRAERQGSVETETEGGRHWTQQRAQCSRLERQRRREREASSASGVDARHAQGVDARHAQGVDALQVFDASAMTPREDAIG
jgi:hypothetical protein